LAGRSASVGVRDRVRTRNASCTPRLVHVSADGVLAAQLPTCNRAICPFLPFRALRCAARKWPVYRDFPMARPGLEPGTPRFSGTGNSPVEDAGLQDVRVARRRPDARGFVWFPVGLGHERGARGLNRRGWRLADGASTTSWVRSTRSVRGGGPRRPRFAGRSSTAPVARSPRIAVHSRRYLRSLNHAVGSDDRRPATRHRRTRALCRRPQCSCRSPSLRRAGVGDTLDRPRTRLRPRCRRDRGDRCRASEQIQHPVARTSRSVRPGAKGPSRSRIRRFHSATRPAGGVAVRG
jgi:hypothetical protein